MAARQVIVVMPLRAPTTIVDDAVERNYDGVYMYELKLRHLLALTTSPSLRACRVLGQ